VQVKNGGTTLATYVYDANGNRVSQTESSTTTDFYYSAAGQDLEERQSSTTDQYVWGLAYVNSLVLRDDNSSSGSYGKSSSGLGRRIYVQHDADYNVTALTDTSGNVLQRFVYTPYGIMTVIGSTSAWSTTTDAYSWFYTFQGGRYDATTGMIHFGARDYSPTLARWLSRDPKGFIDGANLYGFELAHTINYVDPTGFGTTTPSSSEIAAARKQARSEGKAYVEWDYTDEVNYPDGTVDRTTYSYSIPNATHLSKFSNKNTDQYQCNGGITQANKDFDDVVKSAKLEKQVKQSKDGKVRYVTMPHGSLVTIYDSSSSTGEPTIVINGQTDGPGTTKVRYAP